MKKAIFNGTIALLTISILSACFNVYFGIGYILLILSHELGHWCAAKQLKAAVEFGGFTPVGAYVKVKQEDINSCKENAYIALGGPLLGVIISALCYVLFLLFGNDTFLVLAFVGAILNLANLIPCYPFDGGQIVESISPWFLLVGIPILIFFVVGSREFVILLIVFIIGLLQTINTLITYKDDEKKRYYDIDEHSRRNIATFYIALLICLALGAFYLHSVWDIPMIFREMSKY